MKRKDGWRYLAYLLRLWRAEGEGSAVWPAARKAKGGERMPEPSSASGSETWRTEL